jgi:5-methylcytosine-specific restriction protein B
MNTADRSLALVDYALRRRFAFYDLVPQFNETFKQYLTQKNVSDALVLHICTHLNQLNQRISNDPHLGKGYQIGHSYFCNPPVFTDTLSEKIWFNDIIDAEISPLLHEYWFDQPDLVEQLITTLVWIG